MRRSCIRGVLRTDEERTVVVPLVVRAAPADCVGEAGFSGPQPLSAHGGDGPPRGSALRVFDVVVGFHDVHCRTITALQYFSGETPGVICCMLVGRRIGPGSWYLTYSVYKLLPFCFSFGFFTTGVDSCGGVESKRKVVPYVRYGTGSEREIRPNTVHRVEHKYKQNAAYVSRMERGIPYAQQTRHRS